MANMDAINPVQAKSFGSQVSQQEEINTSQSPPYEKVLSIAAYMSKFIKHVTIF
jgi:hypothetical protein